MNENMNV